MRAWSTFWRSVVLWFSIWFYIASTTAKYSDHQAPVVQTLDSAVHWINRYPLDNSIGFARVYPRDSDLSGRQRYPPFEQLGPGRFIECEHIYISGTHCLSTILCR